MTIEPGQRTFWGAVLLGSSYESLLRTQIVWRESVNARPGDRLSYTEFPECTGNAGCASMACRKALASRKGGKQMGREITTMADTPDAI